MMSKPWKAHPIMKLLKWSLTAATAALVVGTGTPARANQITDGTYVFTATDGNTALDGSSITFQGDAIVSWDLMDASVGPNQMYPTSTLPLTPANSFVASDGVLGLNAWYFTISSDTLETHYYDFFEAQNNLFGPGVGGGLGSLYDGFGDPDGYWSMVATASAVPDASGTLQLFAGVLGALGMCRSRLNRRSSARN
jgi:hypothetical protein